MRGVATIDVAGGDLRGVELLRADGERGPVVGPSFDPGDVAGEGAAESDHLAPTGGIGGIGGHIAVQPEIGRRVLDDAIGLAGHDERVLGRPDVERLPAPPQREEEIGGFGRRTRGDGHRTLQQVHGLTERIDHSRPVDHGPRGQGGDDLGVGGDLLGDAQ